MMRISLILLPVLLVIVSTIYRFPRLMLNPGKLISAHDEISNDCFKCHVPFEKTPDEKCIFCHELSKIGVYTTKGEKIDSSNKTLASFHQYLEEITCTGCHSDHKGDTPGQQSYSFKHEALEPSLRSKCISCHKKPDDVLHKSDITSCITCHNTKSWELVSFDHNNLPSQDDCISCHKNRNDNLHKQIEEYCDKCHNTNKWKPAIFNHELLLPGRDCASCHQRPEGYLHSMAVEDCCKCHNTIKWSPALFDHKLIAKTDSCSICHERQKDFLHEKTTDNCSACHNTIKWKPAYFNHENLLKNGDCFSCHKTPGDSLHRNVHKMCDNCHKIDKWTSATFDHKLVSIEIGCVSCHKKPFDNLHDKVSDNCGLCHTIDKWKPATFDHRDYFWLDKDHNTDCLTCHLDNSFEEYTCYGCHEHSKRKIERKHVKHKIYNFENCVDCHWNSDEDDAERRWKELRSGKGNLYENRRNYNDKRNYYRKNKNGSYDDSSSDDSS